MQQKSTDAILPVGTDDDIYAKLGIVAPEVQQILYKI